MKACYASQMREIDRKASEEGNVPSIVLMENAGIACVEEIKKDFSDIKNRRVAVFCGKGNNGGDGFVIARQLYNLGVEVDVYLVCGNEFKGDAKINFDIITLLDINIDVVSDTDDLKYIILSYDIIVDAVFGTGISGTLRGISGDVITEINNNARYVMSVDVPSGINSDSGEVCGTCIKADKTVTFGAYKVGMLMFPAADYVGEVVVKNISIPDYILNSSDLKINVIDDEFVRKHFPKRENNSQKGDYGKVLVIAGSVGMSGAAYLSSQTAVTAGSGLVTLALPECISGAMEAKTTEVMTVPLFCADGKISAKAIETILPLIDRADAVLIGPGLRQSEDVAETVKAVLEYSNVPVVLDADAINVVAADKSVLESTTCPLIFTPHTVELSRFAKLDKEYIEKNRLEVAREIAEENGITLILKGHHTIVTGQDGEQYISITGNAGLATGGSGDVLAGIVASLVSRGINELTATSMAVHIHGTAGDIAMEKYGIESVTATRVMECIPHALRQILQVEK